MRNNAVFPESVAYANDFTWLMFGAYIYGHAFCLVSIYRRLFYHLT